MFEISSFGMVMIIILWFCGLGCGLALGHRLLRNAILLRAIQHGAASWSSDSKGKPVLSWTNELCEKVVEDP